MQKSVDLSLIVAMARNGTIGRNGELPWYIPSDLKFFRLVTMTAGTVIAGRKTFESIMWRNGKPLEGRKHIVLSHSHDHFIHESVIFVSSMDEALEVVAANGGRACIIGGRELYKLALTLPELARMYVTWVQMSVFGDAHFPLEEVGRNWRIIGVTQAKKWSPRDEYSTSRSVLARPLHPIR